MMKRLASGVAAVALVMGGMAFFGAFSAGASSTPTITITPNTGLANLQSVTVTGSGFTPNQGLGTMAAVECIATATSEAGCDIADYALVTSDASGNMTFTFTVRTGTIGNGTCGTSATDATCLISVGTLSGTTLAANTITFASGSSTTTTIPTTTTTVASSKTPSVSVSQTTGLTNGASVSITGADFTPGDSVYAVECLATATGAAGCDTATATPITVNADGTLPATTFKVVTGTVGTGTCGTTSSDLSGCVIEVANPSGADAGATLITFALPPTTTTTVRATTTTIHHGATTTSTIVPVGAPATGEGGASGSGAPKGLIGLSALAVALAAGSIALRSRRQRGRASSGGHTRGS
ncbi:MAG TPA: neocarzinostatin apoprotein domain-containing protein [Acidimicrobiales bacterium]|nr:neocarzinostatin apoprotein domain-containing protein [Acidimicrobiales bacterium]